MKQTYDHDDKGTNFRVNVQACGERKWTSRPDGEHDGRGTGR